MARKIFLAGSQPTAEQLAEIENAARYPVSFSTDSPQLSDTQLAQFAPAHPEYFKTTPVKKQLTLKVDADVLAWFKNTGKGYQTRMNSALRHAMMHGM
jgi:uncharacterized protein (DUF4415 family)